MILYEALDVRFGSTEISEVYLGTDLVWSGETDPEGIWSFNNPTTGSDTIILKATFRGKSTAHWGDGNTNELTSNTTITHTY